MAWAMLCAPTRKLAFSATSCCEVALGTMDLCCFILGGLVPKRKACAWAMQKAGLYYDHDHNLVDTSWPNSG